VGGLHSRLLIESLAGDLSRDRQDGRLSNL
jgi:hypothetical protein